MCVLPVSIDPLCDDRLCVTLQQVPYVKVGSCIKHTEHCRSGLVPLQRDHRLSGCAVPPLRHRLLLADCMQPDAAITTTHLGYRQRETRPHTMLLQVYYRF